MIPISRISAFSITIAIVLLAVVITSGCESNKGPVVKKGSALPEVSLPSTEGVTVSIPTDQRGDLTVLLFWSQGCHYCKKEMPLIEPLFRKYHDSGFSFVAVHMGPGMEASRRIKEDMGLTFPIVVDKKSSLRKLYGIVSVPTMFVLDSDGKVIEKILGGMGAGDIEELIRENT